MGIPLPRPEAPRLGPVLLPRVPSLLVSLEGWATPLAGPRGCSFLVLMVLGLRGAGWPCLSVCTELSEGWLW